MHENRARAESFGTVADLYDRVRPRYPSEMLDVLLSGGPRAVLDVGAGTGIVGELVAARGIDVLCVEPDERMAAVARAHGLAVEVARFECWNPGERRFDALLAGQSWHWVDPARGAAKAAAVLATGGRVGLFWNLGDIPDQLRNALAPVYARLEPTIEGYGTRPSGPSSTVAAALAGIAASGAFDDATVRAFPWQRAYDAAGWCELIATHSDHLALPADRRVTLLEAVAGAIDALGGSFTMSYTTTLIDATRREQAFSER
jgi:SAM-dependent methyltransferase